MRKAGQGKLIFYDLHGGGAKVQIMSDPRSQRRVPTRGRSSTTSCGEATWASWASRANPKEASCLSFPTKLQLLSPCLPPSRAKGPMVPKDPDTRFRGRDI